MVKQIVSQERLKQLVSYDPHTGAITWLVRRGNRSAGSQWGCLDDRGYNIGMIDNRYYRGHQLAFIYMTGSLPPGDIDHINGVKGDNRWSNLRAATRGENLSNAHMLHKRNTSGYRGVVAAAGRGRWKAQIRRGGTAVSLGTFPTKIQAALAYDRAALKDRGEFATLNFPRLHSA